MHNDKSAEDTFLEFLMNRGHIDRLLDVISVVQSYKQATDKTFDRVNNFREQMNWFFNDSGKKLSLDQVGRIRISRPAGGTMPLDALSSGERQLLIIFAHVFFNSFGTRSKVFVVDEPELSLHLRWQENLVERLQSVLPEVQLIFATHSPDIVGGRDDCCIEVGG
jgi:predicted ATPase